MRFTVAGEDGVGLGEGRGVSMEEGRQEIGVHRREGAGVGRGWEKERQARRNGGGN